MHPFPIFVLTLLVGTPLTSSDKDVQRVDFDRTVAPLLMQRCLDCHRGPKPRGGLDLSRRQSAMQGGRTGKAVIPGAPETSLLWEKVRTDAMPPKKPLPAAEKALLQRWIAAGAPWGQDPLDPFRITSDKRAGYDWWAFQPIVRPRCPTVRHPEWSENPIDRFILSKLEAQGLEPSPPADRRTLIRRLSFDLLGLPPSPEDVDSFVRDPSPTAYERLVDRYLSSPHFGVRWARHWLDIIRFGESNGFEFDEFRPNAWPYRDWVVDSFNEDLPYDEFVRLQLAGDVLQPADPRAVAASGFLVAGAYDSVGQTQQSEAMRQVVRQDELEDIVGTVGQTFLGLTVHCARCHDHKFDLVRQVEYYRLTAALAGVHQGERDLPKRRPSRLGTKIHTVTPRQPETVYLLIRGNPKQPGEKITAGGVAALSGVNPEFGLAADAPESERRKRLAAWITHPRNPLPARVIVNRLWQYHLGTGLVDTPNDFGFNGGRPTHPELLDWLAAELQGRQWSLKSLHRLIVLSAAYQQVSHPNETALRLDRGNRLLWRKSPQRMEAEVLRDAMLRIAGVLNESMGGPGFQDFVITKAPGTTTLLYTPADRFGGAFDRRTLYRTWVRAGRNRLLDAFDCPDPSATAPNRAVTTTPLQALAMLNNSFVLRLAGQFAERLRRDAGADTEAQVALAYRLAYGRSPRPDERAFAKRVVDGHGLVVLTRAIFNSNEFLYVD
jgi:Protein of unknown function (DUF1553)/Protein of unknown function (DUF1549)/Planctomycete cytochrome C